MPWKCGVEVKVTRSMPTSVFGGRRGVRTEGEGDKERGIVEKTGIIAFVVFEAVRVLV